jgi:hypothetical protein
MAESSRQPSDAVPKALIHKKILDAARDAPAASVEDVADSVSGATPELVANVLEEYGDPGIDEGDADDGATGDETHDATTSTDDDATDETEEERVDDDSAAAPGAVDRASLSDSQIETLRAIHRHPEATQQELADELGVVRATISNRVNDVDGFDWQHRRSFVEAFFDDGVVARNSGETTAEPDAATPDGGDTDSADSTTASGDTAGDDHTTGDASETRQTTDSTSPDQLTVETATDLDEADEERRPGVARIDARLGELESAVGRLEASFDADDPAGDGAAGDSGDDDDLDPELLHRAATAILEDDRIGESEALTLLRHLL